MRSVVRPTNADQSEVFFSRGEEGRLEVLRRSYCMMQAVNSSISIPGTGGIADTREDFSLAERAAMFKMSEDVGSRARRRAVHVFPF